MSVLLWNDRSRFWGNKEKRQRANCSEVFFFSSSSSLNIFGMDHYVLFVGMNGPHGLWNACFKAEYMARLSNPWSRGRPWVVQKKHRFPIHLILFLRLLCNCFAEQWEFATQRILFSLVAIVLHLCRASPTPAFVSHRAHSVANSLFQLYSRHVHCSTGLSPLKVMNSLSPRCVVISDKRISPYTIVCYDGLFYFRLIKDHWRTRLQKIV